MTTDPYSSEAFLDDLHLIQIAQRLPNATASISEEFQAHLLLSAARLLSETTGCESCIRSLRTEAMESVQLDIEMVDDEKFRS